MRDLERRIEKLEADRPERVTIGVSVEGRPEAILDGRPVPAADLPRLLAEREAAGFKTFHVRCFFVSHRHPEALLQ
jgi:hypothetical protein